MHSTTTTIPAEVFLLPEQCYRCGHATSPVIGLWFARASVDGDEYQMFENDRGWFLEYDDCIAEIIAGACSDTVLDAHGAGPLRWRATRAVPDGYLANTCHHCGAVLGNWPLHEAWVEYQAEGGSLGELPHFDTAVNETALLRL